MGKDQELLEAARKGNIPVVEKILGQKAKRSGPLASLRRGPGANVQDSSGYSSLHHASLNGHTEIVRLLLDHDASTNIVDVKGSTPLHLAAWSGNLEIVELLLSAPSICNVNLTTKDDETALHSAAQFGHTEIVQLLLEHNCDPGTRNIRGETALDLAAQYGRLETVELLVRTDPSLIQCLREAAPDIVYPHTPLHLASRNGHKYVVEVLLRAGFNVNMRTKSGTALHEAALCGKVEVVRTLLEHGVNTSIRDSKNYTVMDLLSQFNTAQASQEIMGILKRHKRGLPITDSDGESISHPFPTLPYTDSDIGSPYENVRPSSKNSRSLLMEPSPGTSPMRWDYQRHTRPPEAFEDRRVSGLSGISISNTSLNKNGTPEEDEDTYVCMKLRNTKLYQSLPNDKRMRNKKTQSMTPLQGITFSFTEDLSARKTSTVSNSSYYTAYDPRDVNNDSMSSRESDNSLYQIPCAPRAFMDASGHSDDLHYLSAGRELDQVSLSSTASSCGYPRRPDSGGTPLYIPMNMNNGRASAAYSPGSNHSKVSPTPPKKPPRRNISISPTHPQGMSMSVDMSNSSYEYLFLSHTGTRSHSNLIDCDERRERLPHGRSVDQYVEMNVFNIALDEDEERPAKELQRGKSEDLDCRKKPEPVAITSMYENVLIKQQNPRRKLRRNPEVYEEFSLKRKDEATSSSSAPESRFVTSAFLMISGDEKNKKHKTPLSPTHYNQPPTPDHPPPNPIQAESMIYEKIRPLSQEYKRQSRDMETETEEEYLFVYEESSGSFSSSVSLSDKSSENVIEEYHSDAPYAGLIKGSSTRVLENINLNSPLERPKTLKKLKRLYENNTDNGTRSSDTEKSSSSEKESDNKENKEHQPPTRISALSPFDEQEEWAKIQEIMASFGTGIVRESVFVAELEKEFQSRLMTLSRSQNNLNTSEMTVEKWLQSLGMGEYAGLFSSSGFDDTNFLNGVLDNTDLADMGITSEMELHIITNAIKKLPCKINDRLCSVNNNEQSSVSEWLKRIHLEQYSETFAKHLYHDMERIKRIWDVELSAVLDIEKIGHRKRILASVNSGENSGPTLAELATDDSTLKNDNQKKDSYTMETTNSNTGTIRHRRKKSRPAPPPPTQAPKPETKTCEEIVVGGNNSIKSQWKHQPMQLITGIVKYNANYLGSAVVREFKGTESSKKSIQKLRKTSEQPSQEIQLAISYRGVKFLNPLNQKTICEHEIKNVNCACQDSEDRCYFAYITKDVDNFYSHVFQSASPEMATDIILTLGQAFELAYQMALRDQVTSKTKANRESHKPCAISPGSVSSHSRDFKDVSTRTELKLNGHPLKMKPLTLSIAAEPPCVDTHRTPSKVKDKTATEVV